MLFAFSAISQRRNFGECPIFGCQLAATSVDPGCYVFWTSENVPSERVRSKPADIGQLLLQCRRRCSRVIVSLIRPITVSRGNHLCVSRRNIPRGKIHPTVRPILSISKPRQGLIAETAASAIIRKLRQEEEVRAAHNNLFKHLHNHHPRASRSRVGRKLEIDRRKPGPNIISTPRWIAL